MGKAKEILEQHDLRITDARIAVFKAFDKARIALSHSEVEALLKEHIDRVTVYRTLASFLEKGIIHKVLDDSEAAKYALCADSCSEGHHHDNHVHFKCIKCGQSECLQEVQIPHLSLPKGYLIEDYNLLIEGVCKKCA